MYLSVTIRQPGWALLGPGGSWVWWDVMGADGTQWDTMGCNGMQRDMMGCNGMQWNAMRRDGMQRDAMGDAEMQWNMMGHNGMWLAHDGLQWDGADRAVGRCPQGAGAR